MSTRSKITICILKPVREGTEITHFVKIRNRERWEPAERDEHVPENRHGLATAKAVAKVFIPAKSDIPVFSLPLMDESGAVEAMDEAGKIFRIVPRGSHAVKNDGLETLPQPFSKHP